MKDIMKYLTKRIAHATKRATTLKEDHGDSPEKTHTYFGGESLGYWQGALYAYQNVLDEIEAHKMSGDIEEVTLTNQPEPKESKDSNRANRLADAFIAIRDHQWELVQTGNKKILVPPLTDERSLWTTMWDKDGLPHFLPEFSKMEESKHPQLNNQSLISDDSEYQSVEIVMDEDSV